MEKYIEKSLKRLQDANALGQTSRVQPGFYEEGIKIGAAKKAPCQDGMQMDPRRKMAGQRSARSAILSVKKQYGVSLFTVDDGMDPGDSRGTMQRWRRQRMGRKGPLLFMLQYNVSQFPRK